MTRINSGTAIFFRIFLIAIVLINATAPLSLASAKTNVIAQKQAESKKFDDVNVAQPRLAQYENADENRGKQPFVADGSFITGSERAYLSQDSLSVNLALNKQTFQSSIYSQRISNKAVDGNTDGIYSHDSVTHTNSDVNAWWKVDLGQAYNIGYIKIWNRTDCCSERLSDFKVYISIDELNWVEVYYKSDQAGQQTEFSVSQTGRYVKIQLLGKNYLSLAEVEVWGNLSENSCPTSGDLLIAAAETCNFIADEYTFDSITIQSGGTLFVQSDTDQNYGTIINVGSLAIENGGLLSADQQGYGSATGPGSGGNGISQATQSGGGGHGGLGGNGGVVSGNNGLGGTTYGDLYAPTSLGSGGGNHNDDLGGAGGGALKLNISNQLVVNGIISANGGVGATNTYRAGGAAQAEAFGLLRSL